GPVPASALLAVPQEQVDALQDREQVAAVVVVPVRLGPPGQQVRHHGIPFERGVPGQQSVEALREDLVELPGTVTGRDAQPGAHQAAHQLGAADLHGSPCDEVLVALDGHVVVVTVEGPPGDAGRLGERMQLLEGMVGDQVGEHGAVRRPPCRIDQHGHAPILGSAAAWIAPVPPGGRAGRARRVPPGGTGDQPRNIEAFAVSASRYCWAAWVMAPRMDTRDSSTRAWVARHSVRIAWKLLAAWPRQVSCNWRRLASIALTSDCSRPMDPSTAWLLAIRSSVSIWTSAMVTPVGVGWGAAPLSSGRWPAGRWLPAPAHATSGPPWPAASPYS